MPVFYPTRSALFYDTTPEWAKAAFFLAVTMSVAGCIGLLLGQSWTGIAFALSLLGILARNLNAYVLSNGFQAFGMCGVIMPVLVFLIAVFLLYHAQSLTS